MSLLCFLALRAYRVHFFTSGYNLWAKYVSVGRIFMAIIVFCHPSRDWYSDIPLQRHPRAYFWAECKLWIGYQLYVLYDRAITVSHAQNMGFFCRLALSKLWLLLLFAVFAIVSDVVNCLAARELPFMGARRFAWQKA